MSDALYRTSATNIGGTRGTTDIADGLHISTADPGEAAQGTNPEQLLAAAWATCLGETVRSVMRRQDLDAFESTVTSTVELHRAPDGQYEFHPAAHIVFSGLPAARAAEVARTADGRCPVSKLLSAGHVTWELAGDDAGGVIR